jgi:drug/metabolite transporter (DMT)-like permease
MEALKERPEIDVAPAPPPRAATRSVTMWWLIAAAMTCLYLVWGSTYLAMKWAVGGYPPLIVAAIRALVAGALIYTLARLRGAPRPTAAQWRVAAIVGALLLLGSNGMVTVASQWCPSSVSALIVAILPVWIVVLDRTNPARRSWVTWAGVIMGLAGVALLVGPRAAAALRSGQHSGAMEAVGMGLLLFASLSWATGSLYSRRAARPSSAFVAIGMQLLCGGALLIAFSGATGEWSRVTAADVFSLRPLSCVLYLTFAGTVLGYTSYIWLLEVINPSVVATYAFINPLVAVALGAWLNREALGGLVLVAAAVIVGSVVVIVCGGRNGSAAREAGEELAT